MVTPAKLAGSGGLEEFFVKLMKGVQDVNGNRA